MDRLRSILIIQNMEIPGQMTQESMFIRILDALMTIILGTIPIPIFELISTAGLIKNYQLTLLAF